MRRWTKRILILLLVFALPPAAFYFYARWQGERELQAVLVELDANDPGWRWDDILAARPTLRDEDDARAIVMKTRELTGGRMGNYRLIYKALDRPRNATIPPEDFEPFDDLMKAVGPALAEARKLRDAPTARFQAEWSKDVPQNAYDDIQKARDFINLLQYAAIWQAHLGNLDEAIDDCLAAQRVGQSLADEPTLIVHLVRVALQMVSLGTLECVLAQGQPSPAKLRKLQAAWEALDSKRAMVQCLRGERAYSHRIFEDLSAGTITLQTMTAAPKGAPFAFGERLQEISLRANLKKSEAWTLRHITEVIAALELPEPERTARLNEFDKAPAFAPGLARMLTPAFQKTLEANRRGETLIRCAVVGLAAERYRQEHKQGHWPKALADLSPKYVAKLPDDPFSGQPLQLRVADGGIVIYSIGPDGKQRGTAKEDEAAGRPSIPYEFRLWNVAERRKIIVAQPMVP